MGRVANRHKWRPAPSRVSSFMHKAFINLIFEVPGEGLREIAGGLETPSGTEKAWKMQLVTRQ